MSASYNYTADGVRTSKTVDGVTHTYYYVDGKLLREVFGTTVLDFFYDGNGTPIALRQGSTTSSNYTNYYYITNLQGDVIRLVDIYGNTAALYSYDPFGNTISATGSHANINPLRYRGYYYDTETGLYYLQSRYYDPAIGRFISCDEFASTGQGILGYNMFAYCGNNPILNCDTSGNRYIDALSVLEESSTERSKMCKLQHNYANTEELAVLQSVERDGYAHYKNIEVVRVPFGGSVGFSAGSIFLGEKITANNAGVQTLKHEYGHTVQLSQMGWSQYIVMVLIPSVDNFSKDIPYEDYYSQPWEYMADVLGDVDRTFNNMPYPYDTDAKKNAYHYFNSVYDYSEKLSLFN